MTGDTKYGGVMTNYSKLSNGNLQGDDKFGQFYNYWMEFVALDFLPETLDFYTAKQGTVTTLNNDTKY